MNKHHISTTNLLVLQAYLNTWGSPTLEAFSEQLKKRGVHISSHDLSSIVRNEKNIPGYKIRDLEKKFGLPEGWLESDKQFLLSMSDADIQISKSIMALSPEKKQCLLKLLELLSC